MLLKRTHLIPTAAAILCVAAPALAASSATAASTAASTAGGADARAAAFAAGVAHITGLAISPLLVLVLLGWVDFVRAGGFDAATLPLHANPWLLVPCTLVLAAALAKKCVSPAIPLPIRKTLDAGEYLEAKLSALVAAGVLLPSIIATMAAATGDPGDGAAQAAGLATTWATYLWLVPAALIVFLAVWITFHAIDGLVLLSPFAIIDTLLVSLRATVLVVLGLAFLASPLLALVLCAPIIVLSLLFAGWCVRLDLFAMCLALDILLARGDRADPNHGTCRALRRRHAVHLPPVLHPAAADARDRGRAGRAGARRDLVDHARRRALAAPRAPAAALQPARRPDRRTLRRDAARRHGAPRLERTRARVPRDLRRRRGAGRDLTPIHRGARSRVRG